MHVVKIRYAIQCYIIAQQSPRHCAGSAMMQRIQSVREMRDVPCARLDRLIEKLWLRLRVTNKRSYTLLR